jgi:lysozyme family protein
MSADSYPEAIRRLLASEGGYVNHPSDPGGPTNFGITLADYRRYVKPDAGAADVRTMQVDEAKAIYRAKYWGAMRCDALPAGVDYCVFDYAVNSARAARRRSCSACWGKASAAVWTTRALRRSTREMRANSCRRSVTSACVS